MSRMSAKRKLAALVAAHEWIGLYEGDDGKNIEGGASGVPEDLTDAYELLTDLIAKQIAGMRERAVVNAVAKTNPGASRADIRSAYRARERST